MQDQNIQGQLWNAGTVRIGQGGGYTKKAVACATPGCTNIRRQVQGAKYCDDHARSRSYEVSKAPVETRTCTCGRTYRYKKQLVSAVSRVWHEFCPDCHNETPLTLEQLRKHNVPEMFVRQWLRAGSQLACDVCGRTLTRRYRGGNPIIDHDHGCCRGGNSCGNCVRGVLCQRCNTKVGYLEDVLSTELLHRVLEYIERKPLQT